MYVEEWHEPMIVEVHPDPVLFYWLPAEIIDELLQLPGGEINIICLHLKEHCVYAERRDFYLGMYALIDVRGWLEQCIQAGLPYKGVLRMINWLLRKNHLALTYATVYWPTLPGSPGGMAKEILDKEVDAGRYPEWMGDLAVIDAELEAKRRGSQ